MLKCGDIFSPPGPCPAASSKTDVADNPGDILTWCSPQVSWPLVPSLSLRETLSNPFQPVVSTLLVFRSWSVTCDRTTGEIRIKIGRENASFCHHSAGLRLLLLLQLSGPSNAPVSPQWWTSFAWAKDSSSTRSRRTVKLFLGKHPPRKESDLLPSM